MWQGGKDIRMRMIMQVSMSIKPSVCYISYLLYKKNMLRMRILFYTPLLTHIRIVVGQCKYNIFIYLSLDG